MKLSFSCSSGLLNNDIINNAKLKARRLYRSHSKQIISCALVSVVTNKLTDYIIMTDVYYYGINIIYFAMLIGFFEKNTARKRVMGRPNQQEKILMLKTLVAASSDKEKAKGQLHKVFETSLMPGLFILLIS